MSNNKRKKDEMYSLMNLLSFYRDNLYKDMITVSGCISQLEYELDKQSEDSFSGSYEEWKTAVLKSVNLSDEKTKRNYALSEYNRRSLY